MEEEFEALAHDARAFLESRWEEWFAGKQSPTPKLLSTGMCRFSSYFVRKVFEEEFGGGWFVDGGSPFRADGSASGSGGMIDTRGKWDGHYWVTGPGGIVIDVTCDQFGYAPVELSDSEDPRYFANFSETEIHEHLKDVSWRAIDWLKQWRAERVWVMAP